MKKFKTTTQLLSVLLLGIVLTACGGATTDIADTTPKPAPEVTPKPTPEVTPEPTPEPIANDTPIAQPDAVITLINNSIDIDVLGNDSGLSDGPITTTIYTQANNGTATINLDGSITYIPNTDFSGSDQLTYQIADKDGETAISSVDIAVCVTDTCTTVPHTISISWTASGERDVAGYYVYHGRLPGVYDDPIWVDSDTIYNFITSDAGTHYFTITTVDTDANESNYSQEVSANIG